jgi:hypothetical protein
LQLRELAACFLSNQARQPNLGTVGVPDFQSALRFFEQSLVRATDPFTHGESLAHNLFPSSKLVHFVLQQTQVANFGALDTENRIPKRGL